MSNSVANAGFSINRSLAEFLPNLNAVTVSAGTLVAPLSIGVYKRQLYEGWSSTVVVASSGATGVNLWTTLAGTASLTLPYLSVVEEAQVTLANSATSLSGALSVALAVNDGSAFTQVMFTGVAPATINAGPIRSVIANGTNSATAVSATGSTVQLISFGTDALVGRVKVVLSVLVPQ